MLGFIRQCDAHLEKYHAHSSSFFMTMLVVVVCGFISPSLLYAAEVNSTLSNPAPELREFNRERPMLRASSTMPVKIEDDKRFSTTTQEQMIQYRNARLQRMIDSLAKLEKSAADLRLELQKIQTTSPSSTKAINIGQVQKQINEIINQFKKANLNYELPKLKKELNSELIKRVNVEKKEIQKKEMEAKQELQKKEYEMKREEQKRIMEERFEKEKKEFEQRKEQREFQGPPSSSVPQTVTPTVPTQ